MGQGIVQQRHVYSNRLYGAVDCKAAGKRVEIFMFFLRRIFLRDVFSFFHAHCCARLPLQPLPSGATADAWNFGLCATKSREPRQARKGAPVPGSLRVPQSTRSSSHLNVSELFFGDKVAVSRLFRGGGLDNRTSKPSPLKRRATIRG